MAYKSLKKIGVTNITLELTSKIFLDEIFLKIKNINKLNRLKTFIKQKDKKNSLTMVKDKKDKIFLENLFDITGNLKDLDNKINTLAISDIAKKEIENIKNIKKNINLKTNDEIILDFTEFDNNNYHTGIKFTFFAKNVRVEVASGGRYKIISNSKKETAVGFNERSSHPNYN